MKQIDIIKIKQAVKDGQIKFFVLEQYDGKYIYCKDEVGETVIVGKVEENVGEQMTEQERNNYCKDCDRSIWGDKSCDINVEDNGYYNRPDTCRCKIVNGKRCQHLLTQKKKESKLWQSM